MSKNGLVDGIEFRKCNCDSQCEICIQSKMTRKEFAKEKPKTSKTILDVVNSDLCGAFRTQTHGGKKYFLTFIDEHSRYTKVYLLNNKSEVNQKTREFIQLMKTQNGKYPKMFNTDRGGEYVNEEMQTYLNKLGIKFQYTTPYTPQLNGIAERKNRTLTEMTRCMLNQSDLPDSFWGEAIITANYMQNKMLTRSTNLTPYQIWTKENPNLT